jgi:hypothetical protein
MNCTETSLFSPRADVDQAGNQESLEHGDCQGKQKGSQSCSWL